MQRDLNLPNNDDQEGYKEQAVLPAGHWSLACHLGMFVPQTAANAQLLFRGVEERPRVDSRSRSRQRELALICAAEE